MSDIGLRTTDKHCRKCRWCAKYDNYDIIANTHTPVYCCTFGKGIDGKQDAPTLDKKCPYFGEHYLDDKDDEDV